MNKSLEDIKIKIGICLIALLAITIIGLYNWPQTLTVHINGAETDKGLKIVYTDYETFRNEDSWIHLKIRSRDIQGKAKEYTGKTVILNVYGLRMPLLSMHRNIISMEKQKN